MHSAHQPIPPLFTSACFLGEKAQRIRPVICRNGLMPTPLTASTTPGLEQFPLTKQVGLHTEHVVTLHGCPTLCARYVEAAHAKNRSAESPTVHTRCVSRRETPSVSECANPSLPSTDMAHEHSHPHMDHAVPVLATKGSFMDSADLHCQMQRFLESRSPAELASRLLTLSRSDATIAAELDDWMEAEQIKRDLATEQPCIDRLAQLTTRMLTPRDSSLQPHELSAYLRRAEVALPLLHQLMARDADAAMVVIESALQWAWAVTCDSTDDEEAPPEWAATLAEVWLQAVAKSRKPRTGLQQPPEARGFEPRLLNLLLAEPYPTIDLKRVHDTLSAEERVSWEQSLTAALHEAERKQVAASVPHDARARARARPARQASARPCESGRLLQLRVLATNWQRIAAVRIV